MFTFTDTKGFTRPVYLVKLHADTDCDVPRIEVTPETGIAMQAAGYDTWPGSFAVNPITGAREWTHLVRVDDVDGLHVCSRCGRVIESGMTDDSGDFCTCEACFPYVMDSWYGPSHLPYPRAWHEVEDDGAGGYYEYTDVSGAVIGTGIYWTEW